MSVSQEGLWLEELEHAETAETGTETQEETEGGSLKYGCESASAAVSRSPWS